MLDIEELIFKLSYLTHYNAQVLLSAAMELMQSTWLHPSRDEVICLGQLSFLSRKQLNKFFRIHDRTFYAIMERAMQSQHYIRPYLAKEAHTEIEKFLNALDKLKGLGI